MSQPLQRPAEPNQPDLLAAVAFLVLALSFFACDRGNGGVERDPDCSGPAAEQRPSAVTASPGAPTTGASSETSTASAPGETDPSQPSPPTATPPVDSVPSSGTASSTGEPAKQVRGTSKATDAYGAWLQSSGGYTAGKAAAVQAVVVAKGDFKCNEKYPFKFKLSSPPAGVTYPQTTVRGISYGKQRSVLTVPFTPSKPGKATISGTFYVSVCNASTCKMGKQPLSVTVDVKPPS